VLVSVCGTRTNVVKGKMPSLGRNLKRKLRGVYYRITVLPYYKQAGGVHLAQEGVPLDHWTPRRIMPWADQGEKLASGLHCVPKRGREVRTGCN